MKLILEGENLIRMGYLIRIIRENVAKIKYEKNSEIKKGTETNDCPTFVLEIDIDDFAVEDF
jgi:hypothetical protein